ncbi:HAD superfamily hydrolase (TIGR01549 family) [Bradyrhizobium elkanii]
MLPSRATEGILQIEWQDRHHDLRGRCITEHRDRGADNCRIAKDRQVDHRARMPAFGEDEGDQQDTRFRPTGIRNYLAPTVEDCGLPKAAIFDLDGTLLDSVDLHALAWQEALLKFGHDVNFEQVRGQIGKGGDKLIPVFLSADEQKDHGKELEEWRGDRFKKEYLPIVRPFSAVPDLLRRVREAGLQIAIASSAKKDEVDKYLDIAGITDLVDLTTSSDDVEQSKPAPDIFEIVLKKLKMESADAVAIGDTPYDAEAAGKAGVPTVGVLCGGFTEDELRKAGCAEVYPGPAALLACFERSLLRK